jgi:hypothetical protein
MRGGGARSDTYAGKERDSPASSLAMRAYTLMTGTTFHPDSAFVNARREFAQVFALVEEGKVSMSARAADAK